MAKKEKHVPSGDPKPNGDKQTSIAKTAAPADAGKKPNPFKDAKPSRYLKDKDGKEFRITPRPLPKKAAVVGQIKIDGVVSNYQVTNNKGFSPPEYVTYYSWITLPDGVTGFIAHDYLVEPPKDMEYTLHTGLSERKDPPRVPKSATVGDERIAKFKATQAKKAADKVAGSTATEGAAASEQPTA